MRRYLLALATLALAGTASAQDRQVDQNAFSWSGAIPSGRWLYLRNLNGPITVEPSSSGKVEVSATKRWRRSDPQSVRITVDRTGANRENVLICAFWTENATCSENGYESRNNRGNGSRNNDIEVEFHVKVPAGVKVGVGTVNGGVSVDGATSQVEASTVNGSVEVLTSGGPVSATTVNGSVHARMGRFDPNEDMDFTTVNGSVEAEFSGELNADVELSTVNGRFNTDYPVTVSGRLDPRHLRATIGKGGPRIRMTTVNGNVGLRKAGGGD